MGAGVGWGGQLACWAGGGFQRRGGSCSCTIQFKERKEDKSPTIHRWAVTGGGQHLRVSRRAPSRVRRTPRPASARPERLRDRRSRAGTRGAQAARSLFGPRDGAAGCPDGGGPGGREEAGGLEAGGGRAGPSGSSSPRAGRMESRAWGLRGPGAAPSHREIRLLVKRKESKETRFLQRCYKKPLKKPS